MSKPQPYYSHNIHNYEISWHNSLSVDDRAGREWDKAGSTKRGLSPANCPARTHHKVQGTNVILSLTAAFSNRGIYSHNTEPEVTAQTAQSSVSCEEKVTKYVVPSLETLNANRNPWNLSGWTCFVQEIQQSNILPTSVFLGSFNIPFKYSIFDRKGATKCPNLSKSPQR